MQASLIVMLPNTRLTLLWSFWSLLLVTCISPNGKGPIIARGPQTTFPHLVLIMDISMEEEADTVNLVDQDVDILMLSMKIKL